MQGRRWSVAVALVLAGFLLAPAEPARAFPLSNGDAFWTFEAGSVSGSLRFHADSEFHYYDYSLTSNGNTLTGSDVAVIVTDGSNGSPDTLIVELIFSYPELYSLFPFDPPMNGSGGYSFFYLQLSDADGVAFDDAPVDSSGFRIVPVYAPDLSLFETATLSGSVLTCFCGRINPVDGYVQLSYPLTALPEPALAALLLAPLALALTRKRAPEA